MPRSARVAAAVAVLAAGCFPIELDVSRDGWILVPRQEGFFTVKLIAAEEALGPEMVVPVEELPAFGAQLAKLEGVPEGRPVFARFSPADPDGKTVLAVTESGGGGPGNEHVFSLVSLVDAEADAAREVFRCRNATYVRFSPDGTRIAVTRLADETARPLKEKMPELHVVDVAAGKGTMIARNVSDVLRWFPGGRSILVARVLGKEMVRAAGKQKEVYRGELVKMDAATGEATALASVVGPRSAFFDVSPDGKRVLFVALGAGAPGTRPKAWDKTTLYEVEEIEKTEKIEGAGGEPSAVADDVKYAVYSPDGRRVLVASRAKANRLRLEVADASFEKFTAVAADAAARTGSRRRSVDVYAGWVDERTVYYIADVAAFGTAGRNLALAVVDVEGGKRSYLQSFLDGFAAEAAAEDAPADGDGPADDEDAW